MGKHHTFAQRSYLWLFPPYSLGRANQSDQSKGQYLHIKIQQGDWKCHNESTVLVARLVMASNSLFSCKIPTLACAKTVKRRFSWRERQFTGVPTCARRGKDSSPRAITLGGFVVDLCADDMPGNFLHAATTQTQNWVSSPERSWKPPQTHSNPLPLLPSPLWHKPIENPVLSSRNLDTIFGVIGSNKKAPHQGRRRSSHGRFPRPFSLHICRKEWDELRR
jgi:hypothetical protein